MCSGLSLAVIRPISLINSSLLGCQVTDAVSHKPSRRIIAIIAGLACKALQSLYPLFLREVPTGGGGEKQGHCPLEGVVWSMGHCPLEGMMRRRGTACWRGCEEQGYCPWKIVSHPNSPVQFCLMRFQDSKFNKARVPVSHFLMYRLSLNRQTYTAVLPRAFPHSHLPF